MRSQLALFAGVRRGHGMGVPAIAAQDHDHAAGQHEAGAHTHPEAAAHEESGQGDAGVDRRRQEDLRHAVRDLPRRDRQGRRQDGGVDHQRPEAVGPDRRQLEARSTDGEIFTLIRDGSKGTGMRGYALKDEDRRHMERGQLLENARPQSTQVSLKIVVADDLPESALELLRAEGWQVDARTGRSPADLAKDLADADGLLVRSATKVTKDLLAAAPTAAHRRPRRHRRRQHRRAGRQRARRAGRQRARRQQHQRRRARAAR